jgi:nicotinamidase-related amidase
MKKCLVVVDFQHDFIDGTLGFEGAILIKNHILEKIKIYQKNNDDVIFTLDTHDANYMDTEEGKHLPVIHCVEGTWGHQLEDDVLRLKNENDKTFIKHTFPSLELGRFLEEQQYQKIELCGLVSNICVLSNAVIAKSACPNAHIVIDAKATASFDLDLHNKALDVLEGLHIEVKNRG